MANFAKPKVYTGVSAALSVKKSDGSLERVAYVTGFTLDLSTDSEDFNVIGQRYAESIPTYNSWTASSDAKASFENKGQKALLAAYQTQDFVYCQFIINDGSKPDGTVDASAFVAAVGYASIESLSIDAGEGVTGLSISLKGTGNLGFTLPTFVDVTAVTISGEGIADDEGSKTLEIAAGNSLQLIGTVTPENATNNSIVWTTSDRSKVMVDEESGFVIAVAKTTSPVTITATVTNDAGTELTDEVLVTVK